tara:strand:- start:1674 stop:1871 length:198 start_codon:yes stop_codon:yes gene_type:complete
MKLNKKQKAELQKHGYDPCVRHVNLYPEDFNNKVWREVSECLGIDDCYGVTLAVVGIKEETEVGT